MPKEIHTWILFLFALHIAVLQLFSGHDLASFVIVLRQSPPCSSTRRTNSLYAPDPTQRQVPPLQITKCRTVMSVLSHGSEGVVRGSSRLKISQVPPSSGTPTKCSSIKTRASNSRRRNRSIYSVRVTNMSGALRNNDLSGRHEYCVAYRHAKYMTHSRIRTEISMIFQFIELRLICCFTTSNTT